MTTTQVMGAYALSSAVGLLGLWFLAYWLYRDYRVDLFRERVFAMRAKLFDLAESGAIAFDNDAYVMLRKTMNGSLRFADRIGFISSVLASTTVTKEQLLEFELRWSTAVAALPPQVANELSALRHRMHAEVAKQVLFSSPLFSLTLIPAVVALAAQIAGWRLIWRATHGVYCRCRDSIVRWLLPLEASAFELGDGRGAPMITGEFALHA